MSAPASVEALSLAQLRDAADRAVTIATAAEAGIFTGLHAAGPSSPAALAARLGLDPRAVGMVLPALAQLGLVEPHDGDRYALTERGQRELGDPDSPAFAGRGLPLWLQGLRRWTRLDQVLRTGRAAEEDARPLDLAAYMAGMMAAPERRIRATVELCLARRPGARRALDLGGGPGRYARAFARAGLDTVLFDTPAVIDHVRGAYGLADEPGVRLATGDLLAPDPLPPGPWDVVLLSNVLHLFAPDEVRALLARVRAAAAGGGVVAIHETLRGRSPRAPWMGLMMLLRGERGDAYSEPQFRRWLEEAGYQDVRVEDLEPDRQLVTARAP